MENISQNAYKSTSQGLGISGLILGILTLLISFIPCFGVTALIFGILALLVSTVGLGIAIQHKHTKVFAIIALILALIGSTVAGLQYFFLTKLAKEYPLQYQEEVNYTRDTDTIFSNSEDDIFYDPDSLSHEENLQ